MLQKLGPVLTGFTNGVILTVILSLIAALALHFTSLSESFMPGLALGILIFSVFIGGWCAAGKAGSRGLLNGLKVALLFICLSLIITAVFLPGSFDWWGCLIKTASTLAAGALGGILGVTGKS